MHDAGTKEHALAAAFRFLAGERIDYCVVGRLPLPGTVSTGDVDLIVTPATLRHLERRVAALCRAVGAPLLRQIWHPQGCRYDLAWRDEGGQPRLLPLDFTGDLCWRGRQVVAASDLLTTAAAGATADDADPRRARPAAEFGYLLAKRVLRQKLDAPAGSALSALWQADAEAARRWLERRFARGHAALLAAAAHGDDWDECRARLPGLRVALLRQAPLRVAPARRAARAALRRLARPVGWVVRVDGHEGAGAECAADLLRLAGPLFDHALLIEPSRADGWRLAAKAHLARLRNGLVVIDRTQRDVGAPRWWSRLLPPVDLALPSAVANGDHREHGEPAPAAWLDSLLSGMQRRASHRLGGVAG